jgi:hypothetical protein
VRHRWAAQRGQIHPFQRADAHRGRAGGELSVLHHRAEHRRGGGAGSAAQEACRAGKSKEIIPTRISFVDIAGLVRGASKGEGLGNQFLANIREVDAIVHVLRCFENDDITHVEGRIDPVADAETVETELMLSDLESLERRVVQFRKRASVKDKEAIAVLPVMEQALALLQRRQARAPAAEACGDEMPILLGLNLLTSQPYSMSATSRRPRPRPATSIRRPWRRWPPPRARAWS